MCGIFGALVKENTEYTPAFLKSITDNLFILSQSRGKEAAGVAVFSNGRMNIHKEGLIASSFIRSKRYNRLLNEAVSSKKPIVIVGHTRLATNGPQADNNNNCPIISGNVTGVHNGIIVNDVELFKMHPSIKRNGAVDSEIIFGLLSHFINNGSSLITATQALFSKIDGSASIAAFVSGYEDMILATNTGSLYTLRNIAADMHIFASEPYILQKLAKKLKLASIIGQYDIYQVKPASGYLININKLTEQNFNLN